MKTNIVKFLFGAAVALSTVSCEDFLTVSPVDKVGAETFFAGEKDLLLFANGMLQNYLPSESTIGLGDAYCDLVANQDVERLLSSQYLGLYQTVGVVYQQLAHYPSSQLFPRKHDPLPECCRS